MSDSKSPVAPTVAQPPLRKGGRRTIWVLAALLATGLTGVALTSAFSQGMGFGPGHWHPGFHGGFRPFDPARAEERADRMVRHVAIELDATDEQQQKLRAVVKDAVKDLVPMREKVQAARLKARELLTQSTVDRGAIESFRTEQLALADAFTKRLAQAVGDAAEILTPEQRRKLSERLPPPGGPGRMWNR